MPAKARIQCFAQNWGPPFAGTSGLLNWCASQYSPSKQAETRGTEMNIRTADYVIIGAGSAGAALANRLTENGRHQVLLLEAGGETHPLSRVPVSFARFINRPGVNWLYSSEPEAVTGNRAIPVPRGKMLGGSS